ncbi:MAG: ABC transporter substrate-binding protein [Proteobacteria bacterium]|nr:ABC transporter substrate-binding protein [Pseudomonadota bacterium]
MKKLFLVSFIGMLVIGIAAMPTSVLAQEKGPIKIGFFAPLTGHAAQTGKDMLSGLQVYLKEQGSQVTGRKIELISEDTEAKPAVALTKVRKLVEKDGVHVLIGGLMASTGYALMPYVDSKKIPAIYAIMASDDLTQRHRGKWMVRTGWTSSQPSHPFGEYAYKELGYRKVATIGYDYAFGWEVIGGFQRTFEEAGGKIIQKLWTPVGTMDYGPYLGQINKEADAVFALFFGAGALQFVKQYKDYGLKDKIPLTGGGTTTDEHVLPSMGDEAIGVMTTLHYSAAIDTPVNQKFAQAFRKFAGKSASYYGEGPYTGGKWIIEAIKALKGKAEDREKFLSALKNLKIADAPRGPIELDSFGNPVQNIYIRKVGKVGGELQNTVIKVYPKVSQFWKYNPDEYIKQPLYTRDYPPLKP